MNQYETIPILPLEIFKFKYPGNLNTLFDLVINEEYITSGNKLRTENCRLHKNYLYGEFFNWCHECLETVRVINDYGCDSIKITLSWANKYDRGSSIHPHVHPNSVISGIFYPHETKCDTIFGRSSPWSIGNIYEDGINSCSLWAGKNIDDEMLQFHKLKSESGCLYLFPSHLKHMTEENLEDSRYTISFNSFVSGNIGSLDALSSMRIEVQ